MNLAAATPKPKHEKTMSRRSTVKLSFSSPWHPIEFVAGVESDRPPTRTVTTVSSAARTSASGNQLLHVAVACYAARRPSTSGHQRRPCQLLPSSSKAGSCLYSCHSKHTCRCMLTCKSAYELSTTAHRLHVSILAIYKSYTQSPSASL